jgi:S-adenosylmethionine decarboxylase
MAEWHQTHGRHILLDVWGADADTLNDLGSIQEAMLGAAAAAGATVVDATFHRFPCQGLSGVVVLAESHISVHTFPEHGYAAFDVFTCGSRVDPERACEHLVRAVGGDERFVRRFTRGARDGLTELDEPSAARALVP